MCPNNNFPITQSDLDCVGVIAKHCYLPKLCIAISQAEEFDMAEQLCGFWSQALSIIEEVKAYQDAIDTDDPLTEPENYAEKLNFVCGGSYLSCGGKTLRHKGIVFAWVNYAYARYKIVNENNDTPNGSVVKQNEWAFNKPLKEIQAISDQYRSMASVSLRKTMQYACLNKEIFSDLEPIQCQACGCGGSCSDSSGTTKGYGIRSTTIEKKLPNDRNYERL